MVFPVPDALSLDAAQLIPATGNVTAPRADTEGGKSQMLRLLRLCNSRATEAANRSGRHRGPLRQGPASLGPARNAPCRLSGRNDAPDRICTQIGDRGAAADSPRRRSPDATGQGARGA